MTSTDDYGIVGAFLIPYKGSSHFGIDKGTILTVVSSNGGKGILWDHVSVSCPDRCPTWEEMCFIKDMFFEESEWTMQLHPPKFENINCHPYCLHLWRPHKEAIPLPPSITVAPKDPIDQKRYYDALMKSGERT
jgi:hypothetical protein